MPTPTLRDKFNASLLLTGWVRQPSATRAWQYSHPAYDYFIFLGKAGAVRFGRNFTHSHAMSDKRKAELLGYLDRKLERQAARTPASLLIR